VLDQRCRWSSQSRPSGGHVPLNLQAINSRGAIALSQKACAYSKISLCFLLTLYVGSLTAGQTEEPQISLRLIPVRPWRLQVLLVDNYPTPGITTSCSFRNGIEHAGFDPTSNISAAVLEALTNIGNILKASSTCRWYLRRSKTCKDVVNTDIEWHIAMYP